MLVARKSVGERGEKLGVFGRVAYRDADRFGEAHPTHRPDDYAFVEEFVAKGFGIGTQRHEEKIGFAGDWREMELGELEEQPAALGAVGFDRAADVFGVVESGKSGGLPHARNVERSAELVHFSD